MPSSVRSKRGQLSFFVRQWHSGVLYEASCAGIKVITWFEIQEHLRSNGGT